MSALKGNQTLEEGEELTINLPIGYNYSNFSDIIEENLHFYCNELKTDEEIQHWVKEFGEQNYVEWRIARTHPRLQGIKCCYRIDYRCQHSSTWYEKSGNVRQSKSVQCPSKLFIKRIQKSKYDNGERCTVIYLRNQHNHPTGTTATSLKYRDVGEKTKRKLRKLFSKGYSPSSAYQMLHSEALMQFGDDYESMAADRNKLPDLSYCYNIFYKVLRHEYDSLGDDDDDDDDQAECSEPEDADEKPCKTKSNDGGENLEITVTETSYSQEDHDPERDIDQVTETLKSVFEDILQRVQGSESSDLVKASETFCTNYNAFCGGENSLKSALCNFGKYTRRKRLVAAPGNMCVSSTKRKRYLERRRRLNSRGSATMLVKEDGAID